jgi:hypothetical protein
MAESTDPNVLDFRAKPGSWGLCCAFQVLDGHGYAANLQNLTDSTEGWGWPAEATAVELAAFHAELKGSEEELAFNFSKPEPRQLNANAMEACILASAFHGMTYTDDTGVSYCAEPIDARTLDLTCRQDDPKPGFERFASWHVSRDLNVHAVANRLCSLVGAMSPRRVTVTPGGDA